MRLLRTTEPDKRLPTTRVVQPRPDLTGPAWLHDRIVELEEAALSVAQAATGTHAEYTTARHILQRAKRRLVRVVMANQGGDR